MSHSSTRLPTDAITPVALAPRRSRIRIFLVDDHDVVREGLIAILGREADFEIVGEAKTAEEALELLQRLEADVIILDYRLPGMNGLDLCREIAERRMSMRVIILSAFIERNIVRASLMAGARGYVVKDVEARELKRTIRAVARGETMVDPKAAPLVGSLGTSLQEVSLPVLRPSLLRVLRLLCDGKSIAEIADSLDLSIETVKTYIKTIYLQLGVNNRTEAAAVALRRGFV